MDFHIAFEKYQLANGMRVILAPDHSVPVVSIYMIYGVGARCEPKGRTGFAHLFEHMMFQGSANAPKGLHFKLVESNGGTLNGSTHPDYTDYYEVLPSNKLAAGLWLEADRMRGLVITEENLTNQKETVKQERRLSFDNQPYATAIVDHWPQIVFRNWSNAHSLIGSFEDLEAATVEDVAHFFKTYYAPNNAVLVLAGDVRPAEAKELIETYFGDIPPQAQPPHPDLSEPELVEPRTEVYRDPHAQVPAVVIGYPGPVRRSPDYYALAMLDVLLTGGESSRFQQHLVKGKQSVVQFEANLGWPFASSTDYKDPGHYTMFLLHDPAIPGGEVVEQAQAEVDAIRKHGVSEAELDRARTFFRATRVNQLQSSLRRAMLLGQYELLDGNPGWINTELKEFFRVTPEDVCAAAAKYCVPERRFVLEIVPARAEWAQEPQATGSAP
ncbi:MAG: pitrilysin family protein [Bryobacterales bacterium]|nr:insulinase family protein [Bryobacteraceae bacterium]MDW8353633.1 pitrilysin family protein [Bryobacterales bacterium]